MTSLRTRHLIHSGRAWMALFVCWFSATVTYAIDSPPAASLAFQVDRTQPKLVKIFGAGRGGLEAYQSGILVSADGHVLTVWSYVLDPATVSVVLNDGRRLDGKLVGMDPELEIAILKIDATELEFFELKNMVDVKPGDRVMAFSNLYAIASGNEFNSVMQGRVAAVASLAARRGTFETPYRGRVFVLDAVTNNAGAAGGALTNRRGELLGILGKELRDSSNDVWLNYALPVDIVSLSVARILSGKPHDTGSPAAQPVEPVTPQMLGLILVPRVLPSTPPYLETVLDESPAAKAGLRSDDLIIMVGGMSVASRESLIESLAKYDRVDSIQLTILRREGARQDLHEVTLRVR
ncbi:MAG: trypsin-like peptidase domain-containing protein [Planctomycetota bacterium]|nr:trypsin-like peptidase domain-containing protein [Planctomycetota bacterium]MDA1179987.1 trypsin-like peptidase domain-containing protein [Planctomycetota bacterium]